MRYFLRYIITICLLAVTSVAGGKTKVTSLSNRSGLSDSSVGCIFQDTKGRLWAGTWDGLNMYTGTTFKTYKQIPDNSNTISGSIIMAIDEDNDGKIWIATDNGISCLDPETDAVKSYSLGNSVKDASADNVYYVSVSTGGQVFCCSFGDGVYHLDPKSDEMVRCSLSSSDADIREIYVLGNDRMLLYSSDKSVYNVNFSVSAAGTVSFSGFSRIFSDDVLYDAFNAGDEVFLCGETGHFYGFNTSTGTMSTYYVNLGGKLISAMTKRNDGTFLIATSSQDAFSYDPVSGYLSRVDYLSGYQFFCLCSGIEDIVWGGTDGNGIIQLYEDSDIVTSVSSKEIAGNEVPVRAFLRTIHGELLIGTKGDGLILIGKDGTRRPIKASSSQENNSVFALAEISDGNVVVGHDGAGISILNVQTGKLTDIVPSDRQEFRSVYSIYSDTANGRLWLGTYGCGLVMLQMRKEKDGYVVVEQHQYKNDRKDQNSLGNNTIYSIVPFNDGKLCLGTRGGGVNIFDPATSTFKRIVSSSSKKVLSSNDILSVARQSDNEIWAGTSYGLNLLTLDGEGNLISSKSWTEDDGLSNNTVHGIVIDKTGSLWLTTSRGLVSFNPDTETFTSYYSNSQMQEEYSDGACYLDMGGTIFAGGNNGYDFFSPAMMSKRTYESIVLIDDFSVKQKSLPRSEYMGIKKLVLPHGDNFFTITFSSLEFIDNDNCEYSYILDGFNEKWIQNGTSNTAVFTNVPPGKYVFRVKGTNGDKLQNSLETSINIVIKRPWWETPWAWLSYSFILILGAYAASRIYREKDDRKKEIEAEEQSRIQQKETYEAKLKFFTNIAHEFGTPLTLISGSCDQLSSKAALRPEEKKYLSIIQNSASRMHRLIQELMEFRKVDTGNRTMRYSLVCINDLLTTIADNFSEQAEEKDIIFTTDIPSERIMLVSDPDALEKIISNLLSNAFKYTPDSGTIEIHLTDSENGASLTVKNTGKGIRPEDIDTVFNRFSILDNLEHQASKGKIFRNGIGLSLALDLSKALGGDISVSSVEGEYTSFCFTHPHLSMDLIIKHESICEPLPLVPEDHFEEAAPVVSDASRQKVLIVDDDPDIRTLVKNVLGDELNVIEASNGLEALNVFKDTLVDLVITDIVMPGMGGIDLVRQLKSNDLTKYIPIVFMSFRSAVEDAISSYEIGGEAFIPKPFYPRHLKTVVHQILSNRSSLKDYYNSVRSTTDVYKDKAINVEDKKLMLQLTSLVEKNITDENMSPSFLCENMNLSRMQLYRKIKELADTTPSEFIRNVKIEHAAHLLSTTELTVLEIMYDSGFNNKSYFFREFSQKYHCTPKAYRAQAR